jgi:hypothetical protein
MFKILTYHQVCPYYLKLITSFGYQARASDPNIGSISCKTFFKKPGHRVKKLGRSGYHFRLTFQLTSFHQDKSREDDPANWSRYRTAIYHSFDIEEARSLWIITTPLRPSCSTLGLPGDIETDNYLWQRIKESIEEKSIEESIASDNPRARLEATFQVLLALAEWGWEDWCFYLHHISEDIMHIVSIVQILSINLL